MGRTPAKIVSKLTELYQFPRAYGIAHNGQWSRKKIKGKAVLLSGKRLGIILENKPLIVNISNVDASSTILNEQCFIVFDFDAKNPNNSKEVLKRVYREIMIEHPELEDSIIITFSGKKGFHIWIFLDRSVSKSAIYYWQKHILLSAGLYHDTTHIFREYVGSNFSEDRGEELCSVDTLSDIGEGKMIKMMLSKHPNRTGYFEIPIRIGDIDDFNCNIKPKDDDFDTAYDIILNTELANVSMFNFDYSSKIENIETSSGTRTRSVSIVRTEYVKTPGESNAIEDILTFVGSVPCLRSCYDMSISRPGIYYHRANIVAALSKAGFELPDIQYFFKEFINDAEDNLRPDVLQYQCSYWYNRNLIANCHKFQNESYSGRCCPGECGRARPSDAEVRTLCENVNLMRKDASVSKRDIMSMADDIIASPVNTLVHKTTRAGVTTSLTIKACSAGKKVLVLVPTVRISEDTFERIRVIGERLYDVKMLGAVMMDNRYSCLLLNNKTLEHKCKFEGETNQWLKLPYVNKPSCSKCMHNHMLSNRSGDIDIKEHPIISRSLPDVGMCAVTAIDKYMDKFNVVFMTYKKLEALIKSSSIHGIESIDWLENFDIVFLDEISTVVGHPGASISIRYKIGKTEHNTIERVREQIDTMANSSMISTSMKKHLESLDNFMYSLQEEIYLNNIIVEKAGFVEIENKSPMSRVDIDTLYQYIVKDVSDNNTDYSQLIRYMIISSERTFFIANILQYGYDYNLTLFVRPDILPLRGFLGSFNGKIIMTDATLPPIPLRDILGVSMDDYIVGDPRNTEERQHFYYDKVRLTARNIANNPNAIAAKIDRILISNQYPSDDVIIVTKNEAIASMLRSKYPKYTVSYFRSDISRGVESDKRIMIVVGDPLPPVNAYKWIENAYSEYNINIDVDKYVDFVTYSEFFQMVSRVKCPRGVEDSHVYCIGIPRYSLLRLLPPGSVQPNISPI